MADNTEVNIELSRLYNRSNTLKFKRYRSQNDYLVAILDFSFPNSNFSLTLNNKSKFQ